MLIDNNLNQDNKIKEDINFFLGSYLKNIGKTPLLSPEEERSLAVKLKDKREKFIKLLTDAIKIVKGEPALLDFFLEEGKNEKDFEQARENIDKAREVADLLVKNKEKLKELLDNKEKDIEAIIDRMNRERNIYEHYKKMMMKANLRLVVSFARKYTGKGVSFSDLIQEGNIGLSRAVDKFDYEAGKRFSTYASWWIRQSISRAITDQAKAIRLPVHIAHLMKKLTIISKRLEQNLKREPTPEEIAREAKLSPEKIRQILSLSQDIISFETPVGDEKDVPMIDFIANSTIPPPVYELTLDMLKKEVRELLEKVVKDPRELEILKLRFGLEGVTMSLREIGKKYGVSRERIRQIQERALKRLRGPAEEKGLRGYLELLDHLRSHLEEAYVTEV